MTKADIENLFELLRIYFPNYRRLESKTLRNAWHLLLEPFSPESVKRAVVERLRTNNRFPDPQEIAALCGGGQEGARGALDRRDRELMERQDALYAAYRERLARLELPAVSEAERAGIRVDERWRTMDEAGFWEGDWYVKVYREQMRDGGRVTC